MKKIKKHAEVSPPLPIDKPATYANETKQGAKGNKALGNRESIHQSDKSGDKNPQREREKLERDPNKRERDPGMSKR
ncbi:MAG: hypothetical protein JWO03_3352 [Bacteroidetes bacterium]|nr:hypothetical protein [Bacteroidota bacterium]